MLWDGFFQRGNRTGSRRPLDLPITLTGNAQVENFWSGNSLSVDIISEGAETGFYLVSGEGFSGGVLFYDENIQSSQVIDIGLFGEQWAIKLEWHPNIGSLRAYKIVRDDERGLINITDIKRIIQN